MSKVVSGLDGATATLTDEEWAATNPELTPTGVFANGVARLKAKREAIRARSLVWYPEGANLLVDATEDGLQRLFTRAWALDRLQLGYIAHTGDNFDGEAEIAGNELTITVVNSGSVGFGTRPIMSGVATGTEIIGFKSGTFGGAGVYIVNISQTLSSRAMTTAQYYFGEAVDGDYQALDVEGADGAPVGSEETYWGINANNLLDMANHAMAYEREVWRRWRILYNDLVGARDDPLNTTDQNKIDAMKVVIDSFDDPANWPGTNIPLT